MERSSNVCRLLVALHQADYVPDYDKLWLAMEVGEAFKEAQAKSDGGNIYLSQLQEKICWSRDRSVSSRLFRESLELEPA